MKAGAKVGYINCVAVFTIWLAIQVILQQHSAWCNLLYLFIDAKTFKLFKYICTHFSPVFSFQQSSNCIAFVFSLVFAFIFVFVVQWGVCGASVAVCYSQGSCPPLALYLYLYFH